LRVTVGIVRSAPAVNSGSPRGVKQHRPPAAAARPEAPCAGARATVPGGRNATLQRWPGRTRRRRPGACTVPRPRWSCCAGLRCTARGPPSSSCAPAGGHPGARRRAAAPCQEHADVLLHRAARRRQL